MMLLLLLLCLLPSASASWLGWCDKLPQRGWPSCDELQPLAARARDVVARISTADKIQMLSGGQCCGQASGPAAPSIRLDAYNWWSEITHGLAFETYDTVLNASSNTALPITTSCAFNRSLWYATGNLLGREARAYMNRGLVGSTFWSPVVNIVRDPRWGRNIEVAGEDPLVSAEYAVAYVQGMQTATETGYPLQASACCKHFVANELERWNGTTRKLFDASVPARDLVDSYLPSFEACVTRGKASGIMCSYNSVNGVPSCANSWLLKDLLRGAWGFGARARFHSAAFLPPSRALSRARCPPARPTPQTPTR